MTVRILSLLCFVWLSSCSSKGVPAVDSGPLDVQKDTTVVPDTPGTPDIAPDVSKDGAKGDADTTQSVEHPIEFGPVGAIRGEVGLGSFSFGVATAAAQIEDQNVDTDWYAFTKSTDEGGVGSGVFVGDASMGYSRAIDDVQMIEAMNLDVYRFNPSWARIEPLRDQVSQGALAHYGALIDRLREGGIRPMITVHHFSNPFWISDPRDLACDDGPTDLNLCGFEHPEGADLIIEEVYQHARLLAERYGDRVDDWATVNEPINYLIASYGVGLFPPGKALMLTRFDEFIDTVRNYIRMHVAIYDAIKTYDTVDADGDGLAANVGFTLSVAEWVPARDNMPSDEVEDGLAADRVRYVYHHLFVEALRQGAFDADFDQIMEEQHPSWEGKIDWLGVQYYFRTGVSGKLPIIPGVDAIVCFGDIDAGSCLPPIEESHYVPSMHYEFYEEGIYNILMDFSSRWPDLPMTVSESGIATEVGERRAEHVVRSLEQIHRAMSEGADVRGYYHWSLMDNFEWAEGYEPRFGLYHVDWTSYERTPTLGAEVLGVIAKNRHITQEQLDEMGGTGPMTPEVLPENTDEP